MANHYAGQKMWRESTQLCVLTPLHLGVHDVHEWLLQANSKIEDTRYNALSRLPTKVYVDFAALAITFASELTER